MKNSLTYLLRISRAGLLSLPVLAGVLTLGMLLCGSPMNINVPLAALTNNVHTYYGLFPLMCVMMVFMFAFGLSTSYLNLALSFGARRVDFFWAAHGLMVVYTVICVVLRVVMSALPHLLNWPNLDHWNFLLSLGDRSGWLYPAICLFFQILGCLCGFLYARSRFWSVVVMVATILFGIGATVFLLFSADHAPGSWGDLPWILALVMVIAAAVSEWFIWRKIKFAVVR